MPLKYLMWYMKNKNHRVTVLGLKTVPMKKWDCFRDITHIEVQPVLPPYKPWQMRIALRCHVIMIEDLRSRNVNRPLQLCDEWGWRGGCIAMVSMKRWKLPLYNTYAFINVGCEEGEIGENDMTSLWPQFGGFYQHFLWHETQPKFHDNPTSWIRDEKKKRLVYWWRHN